MAHSLKGVAGSTGAMTMEHAASEIEIALRQADLPLAAALFKNLEIEFDRFKNKLKGLEILQKRNSLL
ncbi:MAG TPA: Hpt domain-containing protein [Thermodesulfovibrionia bacterium]|nr:Hpt domain-containing protein [Thermodesulfovibrionia bacterium]